MQCFCTQTDNRNESETCSFLDFSAAGPSNVPASHRGDPLSSTADTTAPPSQASNAPITAPRTSQSALFTPAERALLPNNPSLNPLNRKALKQQAKKRAKQARESERKEREADEDMFDASAMFGSMTVTRPKAPEVKKKKKAAVPKEKRGGVAPVTMDDETKKELEFMSFLNSVGGEFVRPWLRMFFFLIMLTLQACSADEEEDDMEL